MFLFRKPSYRIPPDATRFDIAWAKAWFWIGFVGVYALAALAIAVPLWLASPR